MENPLEEANKTAQEKEQQIISLSQQLEDMKILMIASQNKRRLSAIKE